MLFLPMVYMVRGTSVPFYYLKGDHDKVIMTFSSQPTNLSRVRGSLPIPIIMLEMGYPN